MLINPCPTGGAGDGVLVNGCYSHPLALEITLAAAQAAICHLGGEKGCVLLADFSLSAARAAGAEMLLPVLSGSEKVWHPAGRHL